MPFSVSGQRVPRTTERRAEDDRVTMAGSALRKAEASAPFGMNGEESWVTLAAAVSAFAAAAIEDAKAPPRIVSQPIPPQGRHEGNLIAGALDDGMRPAIGPDVLVPQQVCLDQRLV